jgi:hypothetical protein
MWRTYNPFGSPFAGTEKEFSTMKIIHWAIVFGLLGVVFCGRALADEDSSWPVRQQTAVQPAATEYDSFFHPAWQEETGESPSDQPRPQAAQSPPEEAGCREACGTCRGRLCGRDPCGCGCDDPWGLPQPRFLASRGIKLGGWLDVGISAVANDPADRFNGVVTFDDRDGEAQMNQLWLYLNREVDTGGYGWGWGGRVDFVYGTDAFFTQCADGLEANWHQTERFYQAALPQFYVDVGYNDWTIRMGHFFTIIGYEVVQAPENFFYSHAYTHQYGEPFTHFGLLAMYKVNDQWSLSGGFTRGWDNLDDTIGKNSLGLLGGANWTSWNDRLELRFAITASEEGPLLRRPARLRSRRGAGPDEGRVVRPEPVSPLRDQSPLGGRPARGVVPRPGRHPRDGRAAHQRASRGFFPGELLRDYRRVGLETAAEHPRPPRGPLGLVRRFRSGPAASLRLR